MAKAPLYIYLDEGGDLGFSNMGSRFFVLTTVTCLGLPVWADQLNLLRDELAATGLVIPYFHASEDRQAVRNRVFEVIQTHAQKFWIDALIVEKAKTGPALQNHVQFYSRMIGYLLRWRVRNLNPAVVEKYHVITDRLPASKHDRKAVEKAIKEELTKPVPGAAIWGSSNIPYEVTHDASKNHAALQIADYCNWAIYRKWTNGDLRSYDLIKARIKSEFDIFKRGTRLYY